MSFPPLKNTAEAVKTPTGEVAQGSRTANGLADYGFSRAEVAAYLLQLTGELAALARCQRLDCVAYFLEMARIEASIIERDERKD